MGDRALLLEAIRTHPADDTLRLVYADWLDEFGEDDLDRATVEFIRVSCSRGTKPGCSMPKPAYAWIHDHWKRLLPTAFAAYPYGKTEVVSRWSVSRGETYASVETSGAWAKWYRDGRHIDTAWRLTSGTDGLTGRRFSVRFRFGRGFLEGVDYYARDVANHLIPLVCADQPFIPRPWVVSPARFGGGIPDGLTQEVTA